jgi:hypothetical protein
MAYFDLEYQVRTDGQFRHKLSQLSRRIDAARIQDNGTNGKYRNALWTFIKFCKFNTLFLTPYYWPKYPKRKPLSFSDYPFAFAMMNFQIGGFQIFRASRQVAKSTTFAVRQLLNARLFPGFASIYVCPRSQQLQTYANRLLEMQRASVFANSAQTKYRDNLKFKEFSNGSRIELVHVNISADNIRSKSSDELVFDETQAFDSDLLTETLQCQAASHMPTTTYAGTSLTTDTLLEDKFAQSSSAFWVTKCTGCNHYNVPTLEEGVLDMIQPKGFSCCKCGKLLDTRTGAFMHQYPHLINLQRVGFHVPQIVLPSVLNNPTRWHDIYQQKQTTDTRHFLQEIIGIPTEEGEREITKQQLMDICDLGPQHLLQEKAIKGGYNFIVSGMDWGGTDYLPDLNLKKSTTVHVIVGVKSTGQIDILYFRRYPGMNYDEIIDTIIFKHQQLRGTAMASDFGGGQVYNSKIRERIGPEKHIIFCYVGPLTAFISEPHGPHMFNQWSLNKTESISMTYEAIRKHRIHCYDWAESGPYLMDALNMYRAIGEKRGESGTSHFLYRPHPSKPNDALQALNYAFMLGKVLNGEAMFGDASLKMRMDNLLHGNFNYLGGQTNNMHGISG